MALNLLSAQLVYSSFDFPAKLTPVRQAIAGGLAGLVFSLLAGAAALAQPIVVPNPSTSAPAPSSPALPTPNPPLPLGPDLTNPGPNLQLGPTIPANPNGGSLLDPATEPNFTVDPVEGSPSDVLPKWKFNFGVAAVGFYRSNIFLTSTNEVEDFIVEIAPYVELAWGDYRDRTGTFGRIKYTAIGRMYDDNDSLDRVDQDAILTLQIQLAKTRLNFDFMYKSLSTPDFDLTGLNRRQIYSGNLGAQYQLTGKTTLETVATAAWKNYDTGISSQTYFGELWMDSAIKPKLRLGVGLQGGVLKQDGSPEQTFGDVLLRGSWAMTEKITIRAKAGLDYRDTVQSKINFIGSLGLVYRPTETRQFSLDFDRGIFASASEIGTNMVGTSVIGRFQQSIFQRIQFRLAAGYTKADYKQATVNAVIEPRSDNIFFVAPEIAYTIRHWLTVAVFYTYTTDDSNRQNASFTDNMVGIRLSGDF